MARALSVFLLFGLLFAHFEQTVDADIGVCYGLLGDDLPRNQQEVIDLFKQYNIRRMRIYDPNHEVLEALRGTGIELVLGVPNPDIQRLAGSQAEADAWVQNNVGNFAENVQFKYIVVGNELAPREAAAGSLVPAMQNVQTALRNLGLPIKVSTSITNGAVDGFPPSQGVFKPDYRQMLGPVVRFLAENDSPLLVNLYPYFSFVGNPVIHLDYALFTSPSVVVHDEGTNLDYQNLFDALLDTVYAALEKSLATEFSLTQSGTRGNKTNVVVSEIGWPTFGGGHAAVENARVHNNNGGQETVENAMVHNNNLVQHVKGGTPRRPEGPIEAYIFSMFDEAGKQGDEIERHFGIFSPNKDLKYPMNFN